MRRHMALRALLLTGVLAVSVWLIYEYELIIILGRWIVGSAGAIRIFFQRLAVGTFRSFFMRQALKPLWTGIGLAWLVSYTSKRFKTVFGSKISNSWRFVKGSWRSQPWHIKTIVVVSGTVVIFFLGWGLWLIPFGLPFFGRIAVKAKAAWADSWIRRKMRKIRFRIRRFLRNNDRRWVCRSVRAIQYYLICRDRTWSKRADKAVSMISRKKRIETN